MWRSGEVFQMHEGIPLKVGSSGSSLMTRERVHGGSTVEHHLCVTSDVTQDLGHGDQGCSQG